MNSVLEYSNDESSLEIEDGSVVSQIDDMAETSLIEIFEESILTESSDPICSVLESIEVQTYILESVEEVVSVLETSPPRGERGPSGTGANTPGSITGDFLRWNNLTESWEVSSEPVVLKGLVLTPALASLIDTEGALYYNSALKSVLVCTDI